MESNVDRLFTEEIRNSAARAFGADPEMLEFLGDFESYVFGYERDGERRVLRVSHSSHRSAEQIEAELDWVGYLTERGVHLARPVRSLAGTWTHTEGNAGSSFHACAFTRVPGSLPRPEDRTPEFFRRWGAFLGRSHRLTAGYEPSPGITPRHQWNEDPFIRAGHDYIPEENVTTRRRWRELFGQLERLPKGPDSFGICHTDLHPENFHLHDGEIHAFDTDDCSYHWFLEDLSSVLFYSRDEDVAGKDPVGFLRSAWPEVWRGYREEHDLPTSWLDHLELFLQARRIVLYSLVQMKFEPGHEVRMRWEEARRERIDPGSPVLGLDLRALAESV